jgi:hypothetical protein
MKSIFIFILFLITWPTKADWNGALGGLGNAMSEIADRKAEEERLLLQHRMEMERLQRLEDAQIRIEQRRAELEMQERIKSEEQARRNQINILSLSHPDWEKVSKSEDFAKWKSLLPTETQQAIADSWDADFLTKAFTAFKEWNLKKNTQIAKKKKK